MSGPVEGTGGGITLRAGLRALDTAASRERVRAGSIILVIGYAAGIAALLVSLRHGLDPRGKPAGADFIIFYGVSRLTLAGQALAAYAPQALMAAEQAVFPASQGLFLWTYPPTFQLIAAPLALIPYGWALAAWTAGGLALYLATVRAATGGGALLPALAFPGVFMNAVQGQTGFLMTAVLGGGLMLMEARPWLAGAALGLLAVKPQFGLLLPLVCLAGGRWKTAAAGAASGLLVCAAATAAFGLDGWRDFADASVRTGGYLASGALPLAKDPSLFAALIGFGLAPGPALALHLVQALAAVVLAWPLWRRGPADLCAAAAILATLIALPYLFDYDLALLAVPIAIAGRRLASLSEGPAGTRAALALLAVLPIALAPLCQYARLPIGPIALWCGLLAVLAIERRIGDDSAAVSE
jgi:hypothetical protein